MQVLGTFEQLKLQAVIWCYTFAVDESNEVTDTAQLIRSVGSVFHVHVEVAS